MVSIDKSLIFLLTSTDGRGDIGRSAATTAAILHVAAAAPNVAIPAAKCWQSDTAAAGSIRPAAATVSRDAATSATYQVAAATSGAAGPKARTARSSDGLRWSFSEPRPVVGRH